MIGHLHYIMSSKYELFLFSLLSVALVIINHHVQKNLAFDFNAKFNLYFYFTSSANLSINLKKAIFLELSGLYLNIPKSL